jgi:Bacterial cellulose synthase subunit
MNKFLTLLALVFLLSKASLAQSIVSFKSLGHGDNAIYGLSGASSFYVKISPMVEINGSKLVLYFEPSQALIKEHSFINIILNDKPAYSARLTKDSIQKVVLNITRDDVSPDKFLKIQIKTLLTISDDICRDLDNPAMWLKVKDYSYLSFQKNKSGVSEINISNCFESKRAIVYPANPSLHDLKAVAWAYARLKKAQNKPILVFSADHLPDSVKNYVEVGSLANLPQNKRELIKVTPQANEGILYLSKSTSTITDTVTQMVNVKGVLVPKKSIATEVVPAEILFVSGGDDNAGYEKAITALGNINILNSTFGDYLLIDQAENTFFKTVDENRSRLTLKQVGGSSDFMSGIGSLKSAYSFKNSDFNFTPKEVEIRFIGTYSGLNPGDRGYFNIYLNGLLISSEKLDASGKLNTSVTINRYQHHKYNTLESEFRFFPTSGECKNSFINFFGEVDVDKSYLESKNPFISSDLSFYQYPEAFNTGTTRIIVSKNIAKYAAGAIGEIIYELNNNINSNNFPEFVYSSDIQAQAGDLKKYNIIALLDKDDPLMKEFPDAPIKFSQNFRLYNTDNNKIVYSLLDTVSTGLAQIFYGRSNNATLVFTATGSHQAEALLAASKSITEQLSTLSSNVCVTDINSNKYLFNINKTSGNLEYVDAKSTLTKFWDNYNLYILLGILILILLSFLFVRSRVQKSQELYND